MRNNELKVLFEQLFEIDIDSEKYRKFDFSSKFSKKVLKLNGKEVYNILKKVIEILEAEDLRHYKNLRYDLKKYKRVHVNGSYVILFYDDILKKVYFVDYNHHDKIYRN